jgi:hypothetical protein
MLAPAKVAEYVKVANYRRNCAAKITAIRHIACEPYCDGIWLYIQRNTIPRQASQLHNTKPWRCATACFDVMMNCDPIISSLIRW